MVTVYGVHDTQYGHPSYSGCGWYRIALPFDQLRAGGHDASYGRALEPERDPEVIVIQRLDNPAAVAYWAELGRYYVTVYEADDNPFALDPCNWLARPAYDNAAIRDAIAACASAAHLVTVTTRPLAEVFGQFNKRVAVLPNCIPGWLLRAKRPQHAKTTIGWQGGVSHSRDLAMIAQAWRDVVDETGCRGHFVGADYRSMLRPHGFDATDWVIPPAATFGKVDFDVALAPLSGHPFNDSKSPIKVMEYAALGIPVVASDHHVYRDHVIDGVTGFLCATQDQWREAMRLLAANPVLRREMGRKAREHAGQWTIEQHWPRWAAAYERALACEPTDTPSPSLSPEAPAGSMASSTPPRAGPKAPAGAL